MALQDEPANDADEGEAIIEEAARLVAEKGRILEMAKFKSATLDRLATHLVAIALFTPVFGILYKVTAETTLNTLDTVGVFVVGAFGAVALHWVAETLLRKGCEL